MEDELKAITILLSERLQDYAPQSERVRVKKSGFESSGRDWSSTGASN